MIDFLIAITREAGERILHESHRIRGKKKGSANWVTDADLSSERFLRSAIHQAYSLHKILTDPGYEVLSEESRETIDHPENVSHLWVIDPLDGTTNFSYELPFFSVSVAYVQKGIVLCGAVCDPIRRELFWAEKGKGAFLNGNRIHVKNQKNLKNALIEVGSPYLRETFDQTYPYGQLFHKQGARIVNLSSAALECCYVACGRLSAKFESGLKPWDIAAAKLIVEEAGGVMTSFQSHKFLIFQPNQVLAGNPEIARYIRKLIKSL